jgi:hypothetical protein
VADADIVVLAIPLHRFGDIDPTLLDGKLVVDAMNYWPTSDGVLSAFEHGGSSEIVARRLTARPWSRRSTTLPPLRAIVRVRWPRSRSRCSMSAPVAWETRSPFSASSEIGACSVGGVRLVVHSQTTDVRGG